MALTTSESMTLMVNGTCASELRTRFCPIRFTYSVTTGSLTSLICDSICWAYCRPRATCPSTVYQLRIPHPAPAAYVAVPYGIDVGLSAVMLDLAVVLGGQRCRRLLGRVLHIAGFRLILVLI